MPTKFAMPVAHETFTQVTPGMKFHQPVKGQPAKRIPGIELFLPQASPGPNLYAIFDGHLEWHTATGSTPNRLVLKLEQLSAARSLRSVKTIEAAPRRIIYENVILTETEQAITSLLNAAYEQSLTQTDRTKWHPSMRQRVSLKPGPPKSSPLRDWLYKFKDSPSQRNEIISLLVTRFFTEPPGTTLVSVAAADLIGAADTDNVSHPSGQERRLVFYTIDAGEQFINPLFYLRLYIDDAKSSSSNVILLTSDIANHPLVKAYSELDPNSLAPLPRIPVEIEPGVFEDEFAYCAMESYHGTDSSLIKWKYNGNEKVEIQGEGELIPDSVPGFRDRTTVNNVWNTGGSSIATMAMEFQVPCETAVAVFSGESGGQKGVYVLLPLTRASLKLGSARSKLPLLAAYEKMLGIHIASYTATRYAVSQKFGDKVTTLLKNCSLDSSVQIGAGQLGGGSRVHFLVDDVYRPEVVSHKPVNSTTIAYQFEVTEERLYRKIQHGGGTVPLYYHAAPDKVDPDGTNSSLRAGLGTFGEAAYPTDRAGRLRVLRVQLKKKASAEVFVSLLHQRPGGDINTGYSLSFLANGKVVDCAFDAGVDVDAGDLFAIKVESDAALDLECEWYLGFIGPDDAPREGDANMYVVPAALGTANGDFSTIPSSWDDSAIVRSDRTFTWGQLGDVLNATHGDMMAAGYTQALISTAAGLFDALKAFAPTIATKYSIARPATYKEFLSTGWLLAPINAMFVGLGYMRIQYRDGLTNFDLPFVSGKYYGGNIPSKSKVRWGVELPIATWADILGRRYNAIVDIFNTRTSTQMPTVRLKHS